MEGGEKKRVSPMRMNPCRRNAGKGRVRRKSAGGFGRKYLDFCKKCVVFRCNDE